MARIQSLEDFQQREEKLRAQLAELQAKKKAYEEKRLMAIGRAMDARAKEDPDFQKSLIGVLEKALKDEEERAMFGLAPLPAPPPDPAAPPKKRGRPRKNPEPEQIPLGSLGDEGIATEEEGDEDQEAAASAG